MQQFATLGGIEPVMRGFQRPRGESMSGKRPKRACRLVGQQLRAAAYLRGIGERRCGNFRNRDARSCLLHASRQAKPFGNGRDGI